MAVDIEEVFSKGGRGLVDLLEYCVISIKLDPLFVFLVREYRMQPKPDSAFVLFDLFCDPRSQTRITVRDVLPPRNLKLPQEIAMLRQAQQPLPAPPPDDPEAVLLPPPRPTASKYLFDPLVNAIREGPSEQWETLGNEFDPSLSPVENLPGRTMTQAQRMFQDNVWQPQLRPRLISAGFRRISDVA